jgi:uncharacterized RDD family membrane protein YckC
MNCRYCGSSNVASDHRCHRCGRRLHLATARPAPDLYPLSGASALAPDHHQSSPLPSNPTTEAVPEAPRRAPYQPALFTTRDLGRVVPIEAYKQRATERRERAKQAESAAAHLSQPSAVQTDLPFSAASGGPASQGQRAALSPEARFSKAPVAIPVHRMLAAAIDFGMVTVVAGVIGVLMAFGSGGAFMIGPPLYWFGGLALGFAVIYKVFWAAIETDSPGLRWCQLKLLHFDGRDPSRSERMERIAWSGLSIMAGGLGLVWSMVDEESLSWHDHSSKTFLTPYAGILKPGPGPAAAR